MSKVSQTVSLDVTVTTIENRSTVLQNALVVCPLATGETKGAIDIVRYRDLLLHLCKFLVRSTKNPSPQRFQRVPMTDIIHRFIHSNY